MTMEREKIGRRNIVNRNHRGDIKMKRKWVIRNQKLNKDVTNLPSRKEPIQGVNVPSG